MKRVFAAAALGLLLAGCAKEGHNDGKVAALENKLSETQAAAEAERGEREKLADQVEKLRLSNERLAAQLKDAPAGVSKADVQKEISAALDALRKELAARPAETKPAETKPAEAKPAEAKPASDEEKAKALEETKKKLNDILPRYYGNVGDHKTAEEVIELLWQADAKSRKEVVDKLKAMVAENPDDKQLRLALAAALTTTFRDVKPGMEQGILANNIMKEAKKALAIDPEFYDAVQLVAVFKANYPPGFPEFEEAPKDLDKALDMQSKMTWEERFGEIYAAYANWFLVQKKYDEALAKAQAGLDKDSRNQQLIDLKKKIEDAKK